jgi:ubiquinone/menaquinone biosynthesis C-methylase UbiE
MSGEYELTSQLYDPFLFFFLRGVRHRVTRLLSPFRDRPVLDLCCGTGAQLKLLARAGHTNLTGVDLDPHMLAVARRGGHGFTLLERDATATGLPAGSFDAVILSLAIHEKPPATRAALLAEAHRLLSPGGVLLVVDFHFDDHTWRAAAFAITVVERLAGREHFRNFRDFRRRGGLDPLIAPDRWRPLCDVPAPEPERVLFGGVALSRYEKV